MGIVKSHAELAAFDGSKNPVSAPSLSLFLILYLHMGPEMDPPMGALNGFPRLRTLLSGESGSGCLPWDPLRARSQEIPLNVLGWIRTRILIRICHGLLSSRDTCPRICNITGS